MKIQTKNKLVATLLIIMISFVTWSSDCPPPTASCWDVNNPDNWGNWDSNELFCDPDAARVESCWIGCDCSPE
jgi:hypothetical protein